MSYISEKSSNKNFWQRFAKLYTTIMKKNEKTFEEICNILESYITKKSNILELACGTGQISFLVADKVESYIATDFSENMIQEANKRKTKNPTKAHFQIADATNLQFQEKSFDVVIISNALHIMPNPELALKEIRRVLKPDGIIFAPTFVYEKRYSKLLIWCMEKVGFRIFNKWKLSDFTAFIEAQDFSVIDSKLLKALPWPECVLVGKRL